MDDHAVSAPCMSASTRMLCISTRRVSLLQRSAWSKLLEIGVKVKLTAHAHALQ